MLRKSTVYGRGFTLWEVMLVLVIMACLVFMAWPGFSSTTESVKAEIHKANLLKIERAVKLYYLDVGNYPPDLQSLLTRPAGEGNWQGPYLEEIPQYPGGESYNYELTLKGKVPDGQTFK